MPASTVLQTVVAAMRSAATYLAVSLYVMVTGPIGMLLALIFRWQGVLYILGHGGVMIGATLAGIKYKVSGVRIPRDQPVVFCSNHQSNIDPPILFRALHPRLHILFKAEIMKVPILGRAFQLGGFVPIDRRSRERAMAAIERVAALLRQGHSFLTFPEGTRSRTGALLPFKRGPFLMAIKAQVPIVPVAVQGGTAAMRKGSPLVRPARVSVTIGEPVATAGLGPDDRDALIARVRASIEEMLAQGA